MGKQDHYASAYGNFNVFTFLPDEQVAVEPVFYRAEVKVALQKHLMLFYTGLKRDAWEVFGRGKEHARQNGCAAQDEKAGWAVAGYPLKR